MSLPVIHGIYTKVVQSPTAAGTGIQTRTHIPDKISYSNQPESVYNKEKRLTKVHHQRYPSITHTSTPPPPMIPRGASIRLGPIPPGYAKPRNSTHSNAHPTRFLTDAPRRAGATGAIFLRPTPSLAPATSVISCCVVNHKTAWGRGRWIGLYAGG